MTSPSSGSCATDVVFYMTRLWVCPNTELRRALAGRISPTLGSVRIAARLNTGSKWSRCHTPRDNPQRILLLDSSDKDRS
jgi:hypothetical protein